MTKRERASSTVSSVSWGRCAMSTGALPSRGCPPYDTSRPRTAPGFPRRRQVPRELGPSRGVDGRRPARQRGRAAYVERSVLRVQLDDQLLLDRRVDDLPGRERVNEDAQLGRHGLEPRRHGALAGGLAGDDERRELVRALAHRDDVLLADPVGRDVHLDAVHGEVAVANELAGGVARRGAAGANELAGGVARRREAGPVHDVVEPGLQDAQQVLTGLAGAPVRLLVVAPELLLQDAVDARGLLLLAHLQEVLALLGARAAVHARRVGTDLDRALRGVALGSLEEQLLLLAAAALAVRAGVTRHVAGSP